MTEANKGNVTKNRVRTPHPPQRMANAARVASVGQSAPPSVAAAFRATMRAARLAFARATAAIL